PVGLMVEDVVVQADPAVVGEQADVDLDRGAELQPGREVVGPERRVVRGAAKLVPFEEHPAAAVVDGGRIRFRHQATAACLPAAGAGSGNWSTSLRRNDTSTPDRESISPAASHSPIRARGSRPCAQYFASSSGRGRWTR